MPTLRLHFIAAPSGSTAVYVATGSVPFSAYSMAPDVLGTESPTGQQQPEAKGRDCKHREDGESKLSLYQEGGGVWAVCRGIMTGRPAAKTAR